MFFEYSLKNFQGFMLLFSYQCPFELFLFLKQFFLFSATSQRQPLYLIKLFCVCQELFYFFFRALIEVLFVVFATDDILSHLFVFVNNFLIFLCHCSVGSLLPVAATLINISHYFVFVNNLFIFVAACRLISVRFSNFCYIIISFFKLQVFFQILYIVQKGY